MDGENDSIDFDSEDFAAAVDEARAAAATRQLVIADDSEVETAIQQQPENTDTGNTTDTNLSTTNPNIFEYLSTQTEGFIKDETALKSVLEKVKGYDSLEVKLKDLEAKVPAFKNDESKAFFELLANGDVDALDAYRAEKKKDYKTMSDADLMREALSKKNPGWTKPEVELELRFQYGENLEKIDLTKIDKVVDPEDYSDAVKHNKEVENNLMKLQRDARDNRPVLLEAQEKIELPKINKAEAPTPQGPTPEEIAEHTAKWVKDVKTEMPKLPNIKVNIDNKEVEYVRTEDEAKELLDYMEKFNFLNFAKDSGWYKEDGTPNILKMAEDRQKLKDFDKIVKSLSAQVKTDVTKNVLKQIKNVDDVYRSPDTPQGFDSLEDAVADAKVKAGWKKSAA